MLSQEYLALHIFKKIITNYFLLQVYLETFFFSFFDNFQIFTVIDWFQKLQQLSVISNNEVHNSLDVHFHNSIEYPFAFCVSHRILHLFRKR